MKEFFHYNILRKTVIQFLDMFNDIIIARYDNTTGDITKYVKVPLKFAPKTKQWYFIEKRDSQGRRIRDKIFPIMSVNLTNLEYDVERQGNKKHKIYTDRTLSQIDYFKNPVPYNLSFELKIASQYMVDITQVLEQILPFFNPVGYIRLQLPVLNIQQDIEGNYGAYPLDLKVVYEGASPNTPIEIPEADYRILEWTLNFKVQGWLFRPAEELPTIKKIVTKFYTEEDGWAYYADTTTEAPSGVGHDSEELLVWATGPPVSASDGTYTVLWDYEVYGPEREATEEDLDVLYVLQMEHNPYYLWEHDEYIALE